MSVVLDDEARAVLEDIPEGERDRVVNVALLEWATRRRRSAVEEMDRRRAAIPAFDNGQLVEWLREDRSRGD